MTLALVCNGGSFHKIIRSMLLLSQLNLLCPSSQTKLRKRRVRAGGASQNSSRRVSPFQGWNTLFLWSVSQGFAAGLWSFAPLARSGSARQRRNDSPAHGQRPGYNQLRNGPSPERAELDPTHRAKRESQDRDASRRYRCLDIIASKSL